MKKLFFILMIALAMTAFVSCNKDNKSDNAGGGGSTTSSKLPDGYYAYETEDEDDYSYRLVVSNPEDIQSMVYDKYRNDGQCVFAVSGSYTYSSAAGSGTVEFFETPTTIGIGRFLYDSEHNAVIMTYREETITLTFQFGL